MGTPLVISNIPLSIIEHMKRDKRSAVKSKLYMHEVFIPKHVHP